MKTISNEELEKFQLNASGLMFNSNIGVDIKDRLMKISTNIYSKENVYESYFDEDNSFALMTFKFKKKSSWKFSYEHEIYHYIFIYQIKKEKNYVFIGFSDTSKYKKILSFVFGDI